MKKYLFAGILFLLPILTFGQFVSDGKVILDKPYQKSPGNVASRSAQNPTNCDEDTSYFPSYGTTAYYTVSVKKGSSLGQFFGTPGDIEVSGFTFYSYAIAPSPGKDVKIRLICNLYKAGTDSLPFGSPVASDTIEVDTVMGSNILLSRIQRNAVFDKPVVMSSGYIIAVESDSTALNAAVVTNNWTAGNGKKLNLGCGSVSGKWYRCLSLNIGGAIFDANMQMYPFVKYKFGTDFSIDKQCYTFGDTVKFVNTQKSNPSGSVFYNYYMYYNLGRNCHRWSYDGSIGSTYSIDGAYRSFAKKNYTVRLISTIYSYRSGICIDTTIKTVYFKPDRPLLSGSAKGCKGDTVVVSAISNSGTVIHWFHNQNDTAPFNIGSSYKIENAQNNDTFYLQAVNGDCKSAMLRVDFEVNDYPNDPITKGDSICSGAVGNVSATSNLGSVEWYNQSSGGTAFQTGNTVQTSKLTSDTQFYVQVNNKGCYNKGGRYEVKVLVNNNFAPEKPITMNDTFVCLRPARTLTFTAKQNGTDTIRWFGTGTGGNVLARGEEYSITPNSRGEEVYYVEVWNGVCGSGRVAVKATIQDYPAISAKGSDVICKGDSAEPFVNIPWGQADWYTHKDSNSLFSAQNPVLYDVAKTTTYFIRTSENGCISPNWDSVVVTVNQFPQPSNVSAPAVCFKGMGTMAVTVPFGNVNWYSDPSDNTPSFTGQSITVGPLLSNVTLYYETEDKGCISDRKPITISIKPRPVAGFTWALQWQNRLVCTPISPSGNTFTWEWGDGTKTTGTPYVHVYTTPGNYTVRQIASSNSNGCKDTADIPVVISHVAVKQIAASTDITVYPVPAVSGEIVTLKGMEKESGTAVIYNYLGAEIAKIDMENGVCKLPMNMESGVYIMAIEATGNAGRYVARLYIAD